MLHRRRIQKLRDRKSRKDWLAQAEAYAARDTASDHAIGRDGSASGYNAHVAGDDPRYKSMVAEPVMAAVDAMPAPWRAAIHLYGYVDVYRAWRRRWPLDRVERVAKQHGGLFIL